MARVTVVPDEFTMVHYDAGEIRALAEGLAAKIGLPDDFPITIEVDQESPFGNTAISFDGSSATLAVQSGAFENPKDPQRLSEDGTRQVLARVFYRFLDRLSPEFGTPPADEQLTFEQYTAWDAYAIGRYARLGYDGEQPRRRYHFRLRHGFTDVADRAFDRLWNSDGLTWADVEATCAETAEAKALLEAS